MARKNRVVDPKGLAPEMGGTWRRKSSGAWQWIGRWPGDPKGEYTGHSFCEPGSDRTVGDPQRAAALALLAYRQAQASVTAGLDPTRRSTLGALLDAYLADLKSSMLDSDGNLKPSFEAHEYALNLCRQEGWDNQPADHFTPNRLLTIQRQMMAKGQSRQWINKRLTYIRRCFDWGVLDGRCLDATAAFLGRVPQLKARGNNGKARETKSVTPADPADVRMVARYAQPPVRAMMLLQLQSAARGDELFNMRPEAIDQSNSECWIYEVVCKGHTRQIPLNRDCQEILKPFLANCKKDQYLFRPADAVAAMRGAARQERLENRPGSVGSHKASKATGAKTLRNQYNKDSYRKAVVTAHERCCEALRKADKKARVPEYIRPHRIRCTSLTEALHATGDALAVQQLAGHKDLRTLSIYAKIKPEKAIKASLALQSAPGRSLLPVSA
jgi:site-specific recombinase XerC